MAEKLQLRYCTKMYQERHYSIQSSTRVCSLGGDMLYSIMTVVHITLPGSRCRRRLTVRLHALRFQHLYRVTPDCLLCNNFSEILLY